MTDLTTRRALLGGIAGTTALGAAVRRARAAAPPALPTAPVTLNVIDVAGQLQLTQRAIETFVKANPKLVSNISFSQAPAPELPGKLKAQQAAGRVDIDLVLTGTDALSAGIDQKLWVPLVTDYAAALPTLDDDLPARRAEDAGPGAGPGGLRGVLPGRSAAGIHAGRGEADTDRRPQELLDWTKAHPKRFLYARPANSGPGRCWLQGLPYLLGDKDPKDPEGGLGQDLGLSGRTRQEHRILPNRHRRDDEGVGRRAPAT